LPASFLKDVNAYLASEQRSLSSLASDEQKRKQSSLKNLLKIVNEFFERRQRKIMMLAFNKSKTPTALIDYSLFLPHEKAFFEQLLSLFEEQKQYDMKPVKEETKIPEQKTATLEQESEQKQAQPSQNPSFRIVKFNGPLPRFLGPDLSEYGPFEEGDIATLPSKVVGVLVDRKRAQEIQPI
jgi:DNA replication initiation complex subunit (GINS family)